MVSRALCTKVYGLWPRRVSDRRGRVHGGGSLLLAFFLVELSSSTRTVNPFYRDGVLRALQWQS